MRRNSLETHCQVLKIRVSTVRFRPWPPTIPLKTKNKSVIPLADTCGQTPRAAAMPEGRRRVSLTSESGVSGRKSPGSRQNRNPERSGPFRVSRMCTRRPLRQSSIACYRPSTTGWLLTPWRAAVSGQSAIQIFEVDARLSALAAAGFAPGGGPVWCGLLPLMPSGV